MAELSEYMESCSSTTKNTFTTPIATATKLIRLVHHREGLPPIKSHDPLITWSSEIAWWTKTMISQLPQRLWRQLLAGWGHTLRGAYPYSHMTLNHVVLWDHVPQLWTYLHKLNVYDEQAWQGGDFPLGTSTIKMSLALDHVFLQDFVTN